MGGKGGGQIALSFLSKTVGGVVWDVGILGLEGAAHAIKYEAGGERALVRRVGEDQTSQAAGVGTKGDGVENGDNGFAKTNHVVFCGRVDDGGVVLPRCFEKGDDVRGGQDDGNRRSAGSF